MGWFDDIGGIFKTITTGGGALGSIARTVAMGYMLKKVSASTNKDATKSGSTISNTGPGAPGIDNGVRLQVKADPNQKIPILYGSAYFGGIVTEAVMSNNNQRMHYVLTLSEKTGTLYSNSSATSYGFGSIYWDDQLITFKADGVTVDYTTDRSGNRDASLNDLVKIYCYAGGSASANQRFPTGTSGSAVNAYSIVSGWTSAHAMTNLVFAVVEVNYNAEKNIKGLANDVKFQITSSMNKPGDVLYDYITNGLYGANIANTEIDTTTITALNSYSANSVSYIDENSVSQTLTNRYQINGLINADNEVMKNVEDIANSAGSWLSYSLLTGKWSVIINRSGTSVASFDDGNILGSISVSGTGLAEMYSSVKVEFPNRDIRDATDYVQINIPIADRNANELDRVLNIAYNFINEPVQAELLGFIELKQKRVDLIISFQSDYTTINMIPGDVIDVTNSVLGFTNKLFRIITVAEVQGDEGLQSEITALEYDSGVYVEDLSRYTRTVTNGFTTTGNIGIPGKPTIAKFEGDARPRIEVSSTAPFGLIEGMEFWLSNDVALGEAQRTYRLIDTRQPANGNANVRGTFTTGETVTLDYDNIGTSNLVVKTRGYNSTTVGPFSSNSAITTFTSTQTTDAVGPDTKAYDELGGLMTALSVISLLNKLDGLFGNSATSAGGVFGKIKDILFPNASPGTNTVEGILGASNTFQSNIASQISSQVNDPAFQANVSRFTGNLESYSIDSLGDVNTSSYTKTANVSVLAWNGTEWRPATTCCPTITFPAPPTVSPPGVGAVGGPTPYLNRITTWPPDHGNTFTDELQYVQADQAPQTGSYYAWFTGNTTTQGGYIYSNLVVGTGSVKLYKSNGTLVETLSASSLIIDKNRVEFPFADREYGINYYIIMDAGVVKYCPDSYVNSPAIDSPTVWNFNTPYYAVPTYVSNTHPIGNLIAGSLTTLTAPAGPANPALTITNISWSDGGCPNANLVLTFSEAITTNSGTVTITGNSGVIATLAGGTATINSNQMDFGRVSAMTYGNLFTVDVSAGIARTIHSDATNYACGTWANTAATQQTSTSSNKSITTVDAFRLLSYTLTSVYAPGNLNLTTDQINHANVSLESQLLLTFNRSYTLASTSPLNISIYEANGTLHQTFDLKTSYASNKTSEIVVFPSSNSIGLNPTKDFLVSTGYYATISSNILLDSCGTYYPGISNTNTITWTTLPFSSTSTVPPNGATNRTVNDTGVALSFAEPIIPGRGRLKIYNSANVIVANISSTNGNVIYS